MSCVQERQDADDRATAAGRRSAARDRQFRHYASLNRDSPEPMNTADTAQTIEQLLGQITRVRQVNPLPVVAEWVDRFVQLLGHVETNAAETAYDLVAAWARVRRVRLDLLAKLSNTSVKERPPSLSALLGADELQPMEQTLRRHLPELCANAITVIKPQSWIAELDRFADEAETVAADADRACRLLQELDDAELVLAVASAHGNVPEGLPSMLATARQALVETRELFVGVGDYITAVCLAMDLSTAEAVATVAKFVPLLEEYLEFQELHFAPPPALPAEWLAGSPIDAAYRAAAHLAALVAAYRDTVQRADKPVLAAATATSPLALESVKWISPDQRYVALAEWREELAQMHKGLPVQICRVRLATGRDIQAERPLVIPGEPATELCGLPARLARIEAIIDDRAAAYFPLELLDAQLSKGIPAVFETLGPEIFGSIETWELWLPAD